MYESIKKAVKRHKLVTSEIICDIGTQNIREIGKTVFKRGDFYVVDY